MVFQSLDQKRRKMSLCPLIWTRVCIKKDFLFMKINLKSEVVGFYEISSQKSLCAEPERSKMGYLSLRLIVIETGHVLIFVSVKLIFHTEKKNFFSGDIFDPGPRDNF